MANKVHNFVLLTCLVCTACAPRSSTGAEPPVEFRVLDTRTLEATGQLTYGGAERFQALYTLDVRKLHLRGDLHGRIEEYLRIGERLSGQPVDVQVTDVCVGGCASVLFLTGQTKTFGPQGVVAFHGSLSGFSEQEFVQNLGRYGYTPLEQRRYLDYWREFAGLETRLLERRGIRATLLRDAKVLIDQYRRENNLEDPRSLPVLWTPSRTELACYGVEGIVNDNAHLDNGKKVLLRQQHQIVLFESGDLRTRPTEVSPCVR